MKQMVLLVLIKYLDATLKKISQAKEKLRAIYIIKKLTLETLIIIKYNFRNFQE